MSFDDLVQNDSAAVMDMFGIPATISDAFTPAAATKVVFDNNSFDSMGVLTDKPQITLMTTDLAGLDLKTTVLTINSTDYRILKPLPDGYGLSTATLARI